MVNYHKVDSKIMNFDLNSIEFKFGMWITKKEFGQRLNVSDPLPQGQFYMSVRVVSKDIEVTEKIARRLIKQFTKLEIIRLVSSSKNPIKGSIFEYLVALKDDDEKGHSRGHSKGTVRAQLNDSITGFEEGEGHSKGTVEGTVRAHLKSKLKEKEKKNNIYIDLKFIDDVIDKVKITEEQYNKLKDKFGTELLNTEILSLDNYIANGKGQKYKDHYRVLNSWCNSKKQDKKEKPKGNSGCYKKFNID